MNTAEATFPGEGDTSASISFTAWLDSSSLFRRVYQTHTPRLLREARRRAQAEDYSLVVSLATTARIPEFARLGRSIAPHALFAGMVRPTRWYQFISRRAYRLFDRQVLFPSPERAANHHISDDYASWFEELFGLIVPSTERGPALCVPEKWLAEARARLSSWGIDVEKKGRGRIVFLNSFAKSASRCWPLTKALELVRVLRQDSGSGEISVILNVVPEEVGRTRRAPAPG